MSALTKIKAKVGHFFETKPVRYGITGFATAVIGYCLVSVGVPVFHEYQTSFAAREFKQYGVFGTYRKHFFNFAFKFHEFEELDRTNSDLNRKLASLEKTIEVEKVKVAETEAKTVTEVNTEKFKNETMSDKESVLASFNYKMPERMQLDQLYTVALGYFRQRDYEKAVVILDSLIGQKDDSTYQHADVYLIDAIAWFKLNHRVFASADLKNALEQSHVNSEMHRKAMVWQAIIAKTENDAKASQHLLNAIVSRYPHSDEAAWVNHAHEELKAEREPAKEKESTEETARHQANATVKKAVKELMDKTNEPEPAKPGENAHE